MKNKQNQQITPSKAPAILKHRLENTKENNSTKLNNVSALKDICYNCNFILCKTHNLLLNKSELSKLELYGNQFFCENFYNIIPNPVQNTNNKLILNLFIYINKLIFINKKDHQVFKSTSFPPVPEIPITHTVVPIEINHSFCSLNSYLKDSNLFKGVIELLFQKFRLEKTLLISLVALRLLNYTILNMDIEDTFYTGFNINYISGELLEIVNYIYFTYNKSLLISENVLHCSTSSSCLFQMEFTWEDLKKTVDSVAFLIEQCGVIDIRKNPSLENLLEIHKILSKFNEKQEFLSFEYFYLNLLTIRGSEEGKKSREDIEKEILKSNKVSKKELSTEVIVDKKRLEEEFRYFFTKKKSLCYYRHSMPLEVKSEFLKLFNVALHKMNIQDSFFRSLFEKGKSPFLTLSIRRDFLYEDTFQALENIEASECKKELRVKFVNEMGEDGGGIRKEFLLLISKEISKDSEIWENTPGGLWFKKGGDRKKLRVAGILVGIALYNDALLDISLNTIIFKKMMNREIGLEDLKMIDPVIYNSLTSLKKMTQSEFEQMDLNFVISYQDREGNPMDYCLMPNGESTRVDESNYKVFISLYTNWLVNLHIGNEFVEFVEGFYSVISEDGLCGFNYKELESIIMGSEEIDFFLIEKHTKYIDYKREDPLIVNFWRIVNYEMTEKQKKKLLRFVTGNNKLPVGGEQSIGFNIYRNGVDSERLVSSHTCFNHLLIPNYSSKSKLKLKLLQAIELTEGFYLK